MILICTMALVKNVKYFIKPFYKFKLASYFTESSNESK